MSTFRCALLWFCMLFSSFTIAQEVDPPSTAIDRADGFFSGPRPIGFFTDDPGHRFFEILRASSQASEVPYSFEEVVEKSSAIARGYLIEVIPGRAFTHRRRPQIPPKRTVLLKIQASTVLKGDPQAIYLVEVLALNSMIDELNEELYSRELVFLLEPPSTFYNREDMVISTSSEAEIESGISGPIYSFTLRSSLFTMSLAGNLTSPIDISREYTDLYTNITSLDELVSHIADIQSRSP